jgi:hypothetical protein
MVSLIGAESMPIGPNPRSGQTLIDKLLPWIASQDILPALELVAIIS